MIGDKVFDCREMFRVACTFCECADMAQEKIQHDSADIGFYTSPVVANSAFACEVFLKAILKFKEIEAQKVHKLRELYDMLPNELKERIKQEVSCGCPGIWRDCFGLDYLDKVSNAFVEWRYSYEHDFRIISSIQINIGFLNRFRDVLREACCQMFFEVTWDEYKRRYNG